MVAPPCDMTPMNCIISSSPRACRGGWRSLLDTSVAVEGAASQEQASHLQDLQEQQVAR